jgi:hypothetical protein
MKNNNNIRCEECNSELSYCGGMTADGPSLDCKLCQLYDEIKTLKHENARLKASSIFTQPWVRGEEHESMISAYNPVHGGIHLSIRFYEFTSSKLSDELKKWRDNILSIRN